MYPLLALRLLATLDVQWPEMEQVPDSLGFPVVKNLPANAGDVDLIPRLGRSPGEGNGNPLQYSCLGNPMDGGAQLGRLQSMGLQKSQPQVMKKNNSLTAPGATNVDKQHSCDPVKSKEQFMELIHFIVQQKLTQHCKAIRLQLKKKG